MRNTLLVNVLYFVYLHVLGIRYCYEEMMPLE